MINELPLNNPKINDIKLIQEEAQKLRENGVEFIIALLHAGNAYQPYPSIYTEQLYKKIAEDTEVDFIVGGHPHNIQPLQEFETKRGPVIAAYSLADFIAYDIYQRCHLSLYLELELTKTSKGVSLQHLKVHSNYMSYENDELVLKNFDKIRETKNTDKKIADLQMLYRQTIQVN